METKELSFNGKKVTIWKMNYGFLSDLQGEVATVKINAVTKKNELIMNTSKSKIYSLVYGILEAPDFGIERIKNIDLGFDDAEKEKRIITIRKMSTDIATKVWYEIQTLQDSEVDIESEKKE